MIISYPGIKNLDDDYTLEINNLGDYYILGLTIWMIIVS